MKKLLLLSSFAFIAFSGISQTLNRPASSVKIVKIVPTVVQTLTGHDTVNAVSINVLSATTVVNDSFPVTVSYYYLIGKVVYPILPVSEPRTVTTPLSIFNSTRQSSRDSSIQTYVLSQAALTKQ